MMLKYLGRKEAADKVEKTLSEVIREGQVVTYDLGGTASTSAMAKAIVSKMLHYRR